MEGISAPQARHTDPAVTARSAASLPGAVLALAIAIGSGLAFAVWGLPRLTDTSRNDEFSGTSVLASVTQNDIAGALSTMNISNADRAILEKRNGACGPGLAWVSIARASGQLPGKIRLQSGNYFSPVFTAGDMPVRVAISYPAPYATGHGVLAAFVVGSASIIRLTPSWTVPLSNGESMRNVTWQPRAACERRDG